MLDFGMLLTTRYFAKYSDDSYFQFIGIFILK